MDISQKYPKKANDSPSDYHLEVEVYRDIK